MFSLRNILSRHFPSDDNADIENNIFIKYRKNTHWDVDTINWSLKDHSDDLMQIIDAGTDILINGEKFQTYFPQRGEGDFPTLPYNSSRYVEYENGTVGLLRREVVYQSLLMALGAQLKCLIIIERGPAETCETHQFDRNAGSKCPPEVFISPV